MEPLGTEILFRSRKVPFKIGTLILDNRECNIFSAKDMFLPGIL
jgi:hypothetical protein